MPVIIVHALGKAPQKLSLASSPIRIGRDPTNDVVLADETVSREHALLVRAPDGSWMVSCVSETNPIVLDGKVTADGGTLREGAEVLVGSEYLLIVALDAHRADQYMQGRSAFAKHECVHCGWSGMLSSAARNLTCPKCMGTQFRKTDSYATGTESDKARLATAYVDPRSASEAFERIQGAKRSFIERVDAEGNAEGRSALGEERHVELARSGPDLLRLRGLCWGTVRIAWDGERHVVESKMLFPALRVNSERTERARLRSGDLIEVGANRFRFVTA